MPAGLFGVSVYCRVCVCVCVRRGVTLCGGRWGVLSISLARRAGFASVNVCVMYSMPSSSIIRCPNRRRELHMIPLNGSIYACMLYIGVCVRARRGELAALARLAV